MIALCGEFEEESCVALAQTIERLVAEAGQSRAAGNEAWWKLHEAAMLALGSAQEVIENQITARKVGALYYTLIYNFSLVAKINCFLQLYNFKMDFVKIGKYI